MLKIAAKAARSWDNADEIAKVDELIRARSEILKEKEGEQWVINKAVHYNEWALLSREDFIPVVDAFKRLLSQFRCQKPNCDSWLSPGPRINPADLRCACGSLRLNLKKK